MSKDPTPVRPATPGGLLPWLARRRIVATRVAGVVLLLPLLVTGSAHAEGVVVPSLLRMGSLFLAGVAVVGRLWCSAYMAGQKDRILVTSGPYSLCRNPLYLFSFLGTLGLGMATLTLTVPAVLALVFAVYYPWVIRREEEFLTGKFGDVFRDYQASTPRFWPTGKLSRDDTERSFRPVALRRRVFDSIWFVWGLVVMEILQILHATGTLPVWLRLP